MDKGEGRGQERLTVQDINVAVETTIKKEGKERASKAKRLCCFLCFFIPALPNKASWFVPALEFFYARRSFLSSFLSSYPGVFTLLLAFF